jgi:hypothetical protein
MDRRVFIQGLAAGSAALVSVAGRAAPARAAVVGPREQHPPAGSEPPRRVLPSDPPSQDSLWPLLAPLAPGDAIGLGWRVGELTAVSHGAAVLTLESEQESVRVHLCRFDGQAHGVAHSDTVDLLLMNRARGARPTDEGLARVLVVLARLIRGNERAGVRAPESLVSHAARLEFFRADQVLV